MTEVINQKSTAELEEIWGEGLIEIATNENLYEELGALEYEHDIVSGYILSAIYANILTPNLQQTACPTHDDISALIVYTELLQKSLSNIKNVGGEKLLEVAVEIIEVYNQTLIKLNGDTCKYYQHALHIDAFCEKIFEKEEEFNSNGKYTLIDLIHYFQKLESDSVE